MASDLVEVWPSNATCVSSSRKRLNWSDRTYRSETAQARLEKAEALVFTDDDNWRLS